MNDRNGQVSRRDALEIALGVGSGGHARAAVRRRMAALVDAS